MQHNAQAQGNNISYPYAPPCPQHGRLPAQQSEKQDCSLCSSSANGSAPRKSVLERYRHQQLLASYSSPPVPSVEDSEKFQQDISMWIQRVFNARPFQEQSPQEQILFQTVQELLAEDPNEVSLAQKHQELSTLFLYWVGQNAQNSQDEKNLSKLATLYQQVLDADQTEPKSWEDFLLKADCILEEQKKSKQEQFYQSVKNVSPQENLTPYQKVAKKLREQESLHNQILKSHGVDRSSSYRPTPPTTQDKNTDPYTQISRLMRVYESQQNKIIPGDTL